jgi:ABC-type uncharacterized transport system permease subunit
MLSIEQIIWFLYFAIIFSIFVGAFIGYSIVEYEGKATGLNGSAAPKIEIEE